MKFLSHASRITPQNIGALLAAGKIRSQNSIALLKAGESPTKVTPASLPTAPTPTVAAAVTPAKTSSPARKAKLAELVAAACALSAPAPAKAQALAGAAVSVAKPNVAAPLFGKSRMAAGITAQLAKSALERTAHTALASIKFTPRPIDPATLRGTARAGHAFNLQFKNPQAAEPVLADPKHLTGRARMAAAFNRALSCGIPT